MDHPIHRVERFEIVGPYTLLLEFDDGTQLTHALLKETRNRKPLRPNPLAPWELRIGALRVFYDVTEGPPAVVHVLAVGIKDRNRLRIGGEEVVL